MFRMPDSYYDPPEPMAEREVERECPHCESVDVRCMVQWHKRGPWRWDCDNCGKTVEEEVEA